jgi:hypothetical protein
MNITDVQRSIPNLLLRTFNTQFPTSDVQCSTLTSQRSTLNSQYLTPNSYLPLIKERNFIHDPCRYPTSSLEF